MLQIGSTISYGAFALNFSIWAEEVYNKKWKRTTPTTEFIFWVGSLGAASLLKKKAIAQMNF